jgi:RNA polymerase sigma factor (sigma-70 family)
MGNESTTRRSEIAELYTRFGPMVFGRCRYLLKNEEAARDATQEVFVKVMRSLDGFRQESSPATWMVKIATNHCLNLIASDKARWRERFRQYVSHQEEGGFLQGVDPVRARMVHQLLDKLDRGDAGGGHPLLRRRDDPGGDRRVARSLLADGPKAPGEVPARRREGAQP